MPSELGVVLDAHAHPLRRLAQVHHVGGRAGHGHHPEALEEVDLPLGVAGAAADGRSDALRAVRRPRPPVKSPCVGDLDYVLPPIPADIRPWQRTAPLVDVVLRIADDGRSAGGSEEAVAYQLVVRDHEEVLRSMSRRSFWNERELDHIVQGHDATGRCRPTIRCR
jgi:hypothetical protein